MGKTQCPFRRHYGLAGQQGVLSYDFLEFASKDEIIDHFSVRNLETVPIAAFGSEFEFGLVGVVQENAIVVVAHKERNAFVQRVFHSTVTRLVAVPHLVLLTPAVKSSRLLSKAEDMFVPAEYFVLNLSGTLH